jgi:hypothetical protein
MIIKPYYSYGNRLIHKSQDQTQALWCLDWSVGSPTGDDFKESSRERVRMPHQKKRERERERYPNATPKPGLSLLITL